MNGVIKLMIIILLTVLGLAIFTNYEPKTLSSVSRLCGYPVLAIAQKHARGIIAIGQVDARGLLVVAQMGFGVVAFVQVGVGLIFGLGQVMMGLIVGGQLGIGLVFFFGQLGLGRMSLGQLTFKATSKKHLQPLNEEINATLRFSWKAPQDKLDSA